METKVLIEQLRDCGERICGECPENEFCVGPNWLLLKAAERLEKSVSREALIKKLFPYGMPDDGNYSINAKAVAEAILKTK